MKLARANGQKVIVVQQKKSAALAAALELLPGFFFQTFGIGHLYSGRYVKGLLIMFGYWGLMALNGALCWILIGFVTAPLTWIAALVLSSISAAGEAHEVNEETAKKLASGVLEY